jgi:DNA/RNA-binding domain of Phe-tRNA-synthetase-like protein
VRHPKGKVVSRNVTQYCSCHCWWHMRCWVFNWRQSTLTQLHNKTYEIFWWLQLIQLIT